jgi:hypothetical protein
MRSFSQSHAATCADSTAAAGTADDASLSALQSSLLRLTAVVTELQSQHAKTDAALSALAADQTAEISVNKQNEEVNAALIEVASQQKAEHAKIILEWQTAFDAHRASVAADIEKTNNAIASAAAAAAAAEALANSTASGSASAATATAAAVGEVRRQQAAAAKEMGTLPDAGWQRRERESQAQKERLFIFSSK